MNKIDKKNNLNKKCLNEFKNWIEMKKNLFVLKYSQYVIN